MKPVLICLLAGFSCSLRAQTGASPDASKPAPPNSTKSSAAEELSTFFGAPLPRGQVDPKDFEGFLPPEAFKLKVGTDVSELRKLPLGNAKDWVPLRQTNTLARFSPGGTIVNEVGHRYLTASLNFDSWYSPPPTKPQVRKLCGTLYKLLGHPSLCEELPGERGLLFEWMTETHGVTVRFTYSSDGPRVSMGVIDRKYGKEFPKWPAKWQKSNLAAGPAGFRAKIDKWLPSFVTDEEERAASGRYKIFARNMEASAAAAEAEKPDSGGARTVGGGTGTAKVEIVIPPKGEPKPKTEAPPEKPTGKETPEPKP